MPQKMGLGHVQCEAVIQNAFHILFVQVVIIRCAGCKEGRGRHLLGIPDYDGIDAACKSSDSFGGWQLRSFVEHDQIKGRSVGVKILRDGDRAHQHAGAELGQQIRDLLKQLADTQAAATASDRSLQNAGLGTADRCGCEIWDFCSKPAINLAF